RVRGRYRADAVQRRHDGDCAEGRPDRSVSSALLDQPAASDDLRIDAGADRAVPGVRARASTGYERDGAVDHELGQLQRGGLPDL
ncbi:hypothetical protein H7K27_25680, partial [Paenibacillus polymyxa]|nr:hypothetical protein [Paenibacillus polymyxa]